MPTQHPAMLTRFLAIGTAAQLAMVLAGHYSPAVAAWFAVGGITISLLAGAGYGRYASGASAGSAAWGGTLVGGGCALLGILTSWALGDVTATVILLGTASSAVAAALGGVGGRILQAPSAASDISQAG